MNARDLRNTTDLNCIYRTSRLIVEILNPRLTNCSVTLIFINYWYNKLLQDIKYIFLKVQLLQISLWKATRVMNVTVSMVIVTLTFICTLSMLNHLYLSFMLVRNHVNYRTNNYLHPFKCLGISKNWQILEGTILCLNLRLLAF